MMSLLKINVSAGLQLLTQWWLVWVLQIL